MIGDPFELYRRMPSHQQRIAAEKQVNVYYVPGEGGSGYVYCVCSALLHERFVQDVRLGVIPDYAVVVAMGSGAPDAAMKERMLTLYGFDHDGAISS